MNNLFLYCFALCFGLSWLSSVVFGVCGAARLVRSAAGKAVDDGAVIYRFTWPAARVCARLQPLVMIFAWLAPSSDTASTPDGVLWTFGAGAITLAVSGGLIACCASLGSTRSPTEIVATVVCAAGMLVGAPAAYLSITEYLERVGLQHPDRAVDTTVMDCVAPEIHWIQEKRPPAAVASRRADPSVAPGREGNRVSPARSRNRGPTTPFRAADPHPESESAVARSTAEQEVKAPARPAQGLASRPAYPTNCDRF